MLQATLALQAPADARQPVTAREAFSGASAMARRMIRDRRTSTAATAWSWYLDAARRRFGASGWRIAQLAGRIVFGARTPGHARTGFADGLSRQGLVRRSRLGMVRRAFRGVLPVVPV